MDFTIKVEKKKEDNKEIRNINDLKFFHEECYGGKIEITEISKGRRYKGEKHPKPQLAFLCIKCKMRVWVPLCKDPYDEIFETVIDGKKRRIDGGGYGDAQYNRAYGNYDVNSMVSKRWYEYDVNVYVVKKGLKELYCPYCGEQLMPRGSYCSSCGANLEDRIQEMENVSIPSK